LFFLVAYDGQKKRPQKIQDSERTMHMRKKEAQEEPEQEEEEEEEDRTYRPDTEFISEVMILS
jgi:hypothetical protein